jgi:hypothetical protein
VSQHERQGSAHVLWHVTPPSAAQFAAWRQLWVRLLEPVERGPETRQPQDWACPRATDDDDQDGTDQAATTASTSPRNKREHYDRV